MAHVPSCSTNDMEVLKFDEALKRSLLPCEDYDYDKWLYVPNFYSEYRYIRVALPALMRSLTRVGM